MKKKLVQDINKSKEYYENELASESRDTLAGRMDILWKTIRMNERIADGESLSSVDDSYDGKEYTMEDYENDVEAHSMDAVRDYIAVYEATKAKLDSRSFLDKFLHPFKTSRENKVFAELQEAMKQKGITEKVIQNYEKTNAEMIQAKEDEMIPIDKALDDDRTQTEIDLEDEKEEEIEKFPEQEKAPEIEKEISNEK